VLAQRGIVVVRKRAPSSETVVLPARSVSRGGVEDGTEEFGKTGWLKL